MNQQRMMRIGRRCGAGVLALILGLTLGGCTHFTTESEWVTDLPLPTPEESVSPVPPVGDSRDPQIYQAKLYYASSDGTQLMPLTRVMWLTGDWYLPELVVRENLKGTSTLSAAAVAPLGVALRRVEVAHGVATVDLSLDARATSDSERLRLAHALANALTALEGIYAVNVLSGGCPLSAYGLPIGTLTGSDGNMTSIVAHAQSERIRQNESGATTTLERTATLYFPARTGGHWLLPETCTIKCTGSDWIPALLSALCAGPRRIDEMADPVVPTGMTATLAVAPHGEITAAGESVLTLAFLPSLWAGLVENGMEVLPFVEALTLTLTTFMPDIDAVRVYMSDQLVTDARHPDGQFHRRDFQAQLGEAIAMYYARPDGTLAREWHVVSLSDARSPRARLAEWLKGPFDTALTSPVPSEIVMSDWLGFRRDKEVLSLHLSERFLTACQSLTESQERALVYAMVNLLTDIEGVSGVRFYSNGALAQSLAGHLWIQGLTLRNPGIIT